MRVAAEPINLRNDQLGTIQAGSIKQKGALQNSPIICAIHLMYWHARLDRAPDHVFRSAAARKRHDQIGLAFVKHPLIAQWASFLAEFVPLALRDLIWLARDAPAPPCGLGQYAMPAVQGDAKKVTAHRFGNGAKETGSRSFIHRAARRRGDRMRRREFISLIGVMAAVWPFVTRAQKDGGSRRSSLVPIRIISKWVGMKPLATGDCPIRLSR